MARVQKIFPIQARHLILWAVILVLLGMFLRAVEPILLPFVLGMLMAYLFDPLADCMETRGVSRGVAAATITLVFFSALVALVVWIGPLLYAQLSEVITKIPAFLRDVESLLHERTATLFSEVQRLTNGHAATSVPTSPSAVIERAVTLGGDVANRLVASSFAVLNVLSLLLVTPIVSFYFLRDWDCIIAKVNQLLPRAYAAIIRAQAKEVNLTLAAYLRGQLYVMLMLSVAYVLIFALLGLNYALLVGVLAGMLVIIPYVGTLVSAGIGLLVAYDQFGIEPMFWAVAAVFAVGQVVESQILTPKVIGERVGLHPLWLLFGMLAGAVLIGFAGVLLAVPLTAVISVGVRFMISVYLESPLYKEK